MTTLRQILANQRNAKRSTGPRTPEGLEASKRNSLTHGMTASTVTHEDEEPLIRMRLVDWEPELRPVGVYQRWLAGRVVAAAARIDWCEVQEDAWRYRQAERAALCWDDDRRVEVERLAAGLEKKPALVALQLRQSLHGCDWLIARWRVLAGVLRTSTSDGAGATPTLPLDPPGGSVHGAPVHQAALVAEQIDGLERHKAEVLAQLDEIDRTAARWDCGPGIDSTLRLIRRYEAAAQRQRREALEELRQLQSEAARVQQAIEEADDVPWEDRWPASLPQALKPPGSLASFMAARPAEPAVGPAVPRPPDRGVTISSTGVDALVPTSTEDSVVVSEPPQAAVAVAEPRTDVAPVPATGDAAADRPSMLAGAGASTIAGARRPVGLAAMLAPAPSRNRHERRSLASRAAHRSCPK